MINRYWIFLLLPFLYAGAASGQELVHYWNFNSSTTEAALLGASYTVGGGELTALKGASTEIPLALNDITTGQGFEPNNLNGRNGDAAGSHLRFNNPLGGSLTFSLPTTGYENVVVKFASRRSGSGAEFHVVDYSTDGTSWVNKTTITGNSSAPVLQTLDFSDVSAADNNANFKIRITFVQGTGGTGGNNRFDNFTLDGTSLNGDVTAPQVTFSPVDGTRLVFPNEAPKLTFSEDVRMIDNSALTNSNADDVVELRLNNSAGAAVGFDATVSGKVITITPSAALQNNQVYYVALKANTIEDMSGNAVTAVKSASFTTITTQTQFSAGDIVFLAYRTSATDADDEVAFLTFVDIAAGTLINFTDSKYSTGGQCPAGLVWEAPEGGVSAGTVVHLLVDGGEASVGSVTGDTYGLSSNGDQVIVYTGTTANPHYITALTTNGWVTTVANCSGGSLSKQPAALVDGQTSFNGSTIAGNVSGNMANAYYNGTLEGTDAALRVAILNPANWTGVVKDSPAQGWPDWTGGSEEPADLTIAFDKQFVAAGEGDGTVAIKINITNAAAGQANLQVKVASFNTASAEDLTFTKQTLTFTAASEASQTINIPIINDNTQEQDEYFVLSLESINGVTIGGSPIMTVFIKDNDRTAPQPTHAIELEHVSSFAPGSSTAEIVVHDPTTQRLFIISSVQDRLDIANFSNPGAVTLVKSVDMSTYGGITSVAVKDGIVAVASPNADDMANGSVVFFNTNGDFQKKVTVGVLPDNISFTPDGKKVLTANEGQPNNAYTVDPEGSVSIIDISGGIASLDQSKVTTLLFTSFNAQEATLLSAGVRKLKKTSTLSQDFEPEYITTAADSKKAWVTIQENNAIGEIDLEAKTITAVWPLGKKDMAAFGNGFDASDRSNVVLNANWPIKAFYIPDGIANYTVGGVQYLVTANEGDEKEYDGLEERTTVGDVELDATVFPHAELLQQEYAIGRLRITNLSGDTDGDGDYDELNMNGSRSFTIWNATTKTKVYDSGDDFERYIASAASGVSTIFNADNENNTFKGRSRAKGPEPEGLTVAQINNKFFAFITLERVGGVMVYDITNPADVKFVDYKNSRDLTAFGGDLGPEGIIYIAPDQSPDGKAYVALANEISGSVSIFEVTPTPVIAANEDGAGTQALRLHPNPATDRVVLPLPDAGTKTVALYQSNGMLQESHTTTEGEIELNVGSFSKGYYLVRVTTPKRVYYSKLVKQ
jgi:hypothetical protein